MRDGWHTSCMVGCSDECTLELESTIAVVSGDGIMDVGSEGSECEMVQPVEKELGMSVVQESV